MDISNNGLELIKNFEGLRLKSYRCPSGRWTIGYGHTNGVKENQKISKEKAEEYLRADLAAVETALNQIYMPMYDFNQNQYDALVSFAFNCGLQNLRNLTRNGARTKREIADTLPLYNKAGGVVLTGLTIRRRAEQELFLRKCVKAKVKPAYYPIYNGDSYKLDEIMEATGATADYLPAEKCNAQWQRRRPIAEANGIGKYTGTAAQNEELIRLAKAGKLRRA